MSRLTHKISSSKQEADGQRLLPRLAPFFRLFSFCFLGSGLDFFLRLRFFLGRFFSELHRSFFRRRFTRRNGLRAAATPGRSEMTNSSSPSSSMISSASPPSSSSSSKWNELVVVTGCFFFVGHPTSPSVCRPVCNPYGCCGHWRLINVISHVCQAPPQPARLILHLDGTFWQWPPSEKNPCVCGLNWSPRSACALPGVHPVQVWALLEPA